MFSDGTTSGVPPDPIVGNGEPQSDEIEWIVTVPPMGPTGRFTGAVQILTPLRATSVPVADRCDLVGQGG